MWLFSKKRGRIRDNPLFCTYATSGIWFLTENRVIQELTEIRQPKILGWDLRMGFVRNILVRCSFSDNWNFLLKSIFSSFPSSLSSQKRISKVQNRVLGQKQKEKGKGKGQVFSNWHLFKTIHRFEYLNHAKEKVTLNFPLSYKCSDILLSLPSTSLPPSCLFSLPMSFSPSSTFSVFFP